MRLRAAGVATVAALLVHIVGAAAAGAPQRPSNSPASRSTQPAAPGSIAGSVTTTSDGKAVPRAQVVLSSPSLDRSRVTVTADDGRFRFPDVAEGRYELVVAHTGLAPVPQGNSRGVAVHVGRGQAVEGLALRLQPEGVIPGRLYGESGSPLAGADVEALSLRAAGGPQSLVPVATTRTDERGEFRIGGLAAGQYFVVARDSAFRKAGDTAGALRYPATFYPSGISAAAAKPVTVTAGTEAPRIEFRVTLIQPARVSGALRTPGKTPLQSGVVVLVPRDGSILDTLPSDDIEMTPDGRFVFRNVPPGSYQLRARASVDPKQVALFGTLALDVQPGRDVDNVVVSLLPGAAIHGRVEWTGGKPPGRVGALRVRAPFADETTFGDSLTGNVDPDGSFRLRGVMAGRHYLTVEGLPTGAAVVSVVVGGRDVLLQPIEVRESEQLNNVRIVLSTTVTELAGQVRDAKGRPAADALVLATPQGAATWSAVDVRFQSGRADADGRYRISGLPPGAYRIAALAGSDELAAWRPDWFRRVEPHAQPITLGAADKRTVDLVAVPVDDLVPASIR